MTKRRIFYLGISLGFGLKLYAADNNQFAQVFTNNSATSVTVAEMPETPSLPEVSPVLNDDVNTDTPIGYPPKPYPRDGEPGGTMQMKLESNNNITMALNHADIGQVLQ